MSSQRAPQPYHSGLGTEWIALEQICGAGGSRRAHRPATFDWGGFLRHADRHGVTPFVANELRRFPEAALPDHVSAELQDSLARNRERVTHLRRESLRLSRALEEAGVTFVLNKGIVLASLIYEEGARRMNDCDFVVEPSHAPKVEAVLRTLGYEMGIYSPAAAKVVAHSRADMIIYRLHPDHLPVYTKPVSNGAEAEKTAGSGAGPYIVADFAMSLTWHASKYQIGTGRALAGRRLLALRGFDGAVMPCFEPSFQFIAVAMHLFREAWLERSLVQGRDVSLRKFLDVLRLWRFYRCELATASFKSLVYELGIQRPLAWVMCHMDEVFGSESVVELELSQEVDEEFLHSGERAGGRGARWIGTMRQRLYCADRQTLFPPFLQK
jgi:hypothetical protein